MELAIYGKGGIGKSTISANLTAALALSGRKVLQIGCDPKHDSTKLLMCGENIPTVLDYIKDHDRSSEDAKEVLKEGFMGCGCIEAGGPKPGVGCAGRGIISAFEFLDRHHIKENYEEVIYDVLGDVVCGGFAVPVRREYADAIFLVTSGEFMALYAANNILKGIYNFDGQKYKRVGGIIYNERKLPDEDGRVMRFARAAGLPVLCKVSRSSCFAKAEEANMTLMQMEGFEKEKAVFLNLAEYILSGPELFGANPLEDDMLEQTVLNTVSKKSCAVEYVSFLKEESSLKEAEVSDLGKHSSCGSLSSASSLKKDRPPLYGCAFNGAATQAVHLTDALVIAHSPRECAFYTWQNISSSARKNLFNRGILLPSSISPNFECTDMGHTEIVFGGMDVVKKHVEDAIGRGFKAVIVISSCASGIIGDDIKDIENMSTDETAVISIPADGDINGDYMEGISMCMYTLAKRLIDPAVPKEERCVNFVNEAGVSIYRDQNYKTLSGLLEKMNIKVNCRFLGDASVNEMKNFCRAPLNILADESQASLELKAFLEENYGCRFLKSAFPVGFEATRDFLTEIGQFFGCESLVPEIIEDEKEKYLKAVNSLKETLSGRKILFTTINSSLDWLISAAKDAGMEIVWIGVLNYLHTDLCVSNNQENAGIIEELTNADIIYEKIDLYKPDLIVSNYTSAVKKEGILTDALSMTPPAGAQSALLVLEKWADLFKKSKDLLEGGWKNDKVLFEKYYI